MTTKKSPGQTRGCNSIKPGVNRILFAAVLCSALVFTTTLESRTAHATGKEKGQDLFEITVEAEGRDPYRIAVPHAYGTDQALGKMVYDIVINNLRIATTFRVLERRTYPKTTRSEGMDLNSSQWARIGAQGVMKFEVNSEGGDVTIDFKLWEVNRGDEPVLTETVKTSQRLLRTAVHTWCNKVMEHYTGEPGAFGTWLAFVATLGSKRKDVFVMQHDGHGLRRVSRDKSLNILPSWSPDGENILFTSYLRRNPDLYIVPFSGRQKPRRVSMRKNLNSGAVWSPDGKRVALTLARDGNTEIYLLSPYARRRQGWRIIRRLTNHPGIDTSPTWSPDGKHIVWVSNRYGSAQLWIMNADGTGKRRLTRRGYYNQTPAWCPQKGSPLIAFTSRSGRHFSIFTYNVRTDTYRRITGSHHGNNEEPSWAPNCQLLSFASDRGGIWVSNRDGTAQTQIYKGRAHQPRWGPWPTMNKIE